MIGQPHVLGIDGVWWAITLSSVVKGLVLAGIYFYLSKRQRLYLKQAPSTLEGEGERSSQELKLKIE